MALDSVMGRLWSDCGPILRRFGIMMKEMLVHALLHYGMKTKAKLGVLFNQCRLA